MSIKMTALTDKTLVTFKNEYVIDYSEEEERKIEHAAYVANMNRKPEWTEEDTFKDFLRVLKIEKIEALKKGNKMRKSKFCENESPVYISDNMTGKMAGIPAISTSCFENIYCAARYEAGRGICKYCFSCKTQKHYRNLRNALSENEYLKYHILKKEELPKFQNIQIVRFEAFGDLETDIQFYNYYQIAKANKGVKFALWSKNAWLVDKTYKRWGLKDLPNLVLVYSSLELNKPAKKPEHFDKVFTVYEKGVLPDNQINCGARSCAKCKRCYTRRTGDQIRELLK